MKLAAKIFVGLLWLFLAMPAWAQSPPPAQPQPQAQPHFQPYIYTPLSEIDWDYIKYGAVPKSGLKLGAAFGQEWSENPVIRFFRSAQLILASGKKLGGDGFGIGIIDDPSVPRMDLAKANAKGAAFGLKFDKAPTQAEFDLLYRWHQEDAERQFDIAHASQSSGAKAARQIVGFFASLPGRLVFLALLFAIHWGIRRLETVGVSVVYAADAITDDKPDNPSALAIEVEAGAISAKQSLGQIVAYYRQAAEQGDAEAQYNLGLAYYKGEGVPQDYVMAHKWLNLAASHLSPDDRRYEDFVKLRNIVGNLMPPDQLAEAQKLAREWKPTPP